jgi:hypothetical protein
MRRAGDVALLVLQWALVVIGLYVLVISLRLYQFELRWLASLPPPKPGADSFSPPIFQRMMQGVTTGLIAVGLGAALFYLRRLYLSRPE